VSLLERVLARPAPAAAGVKTASDPLLSRGLAPGALKVQLLRELTAIRATPVAARAAASASPGAAPADAGAEPALFAPDFPPPMYEMLRDYFPDFLLPGLDQVPPNTIAKLVTNSAFIEAFMVGLNHEMAKELLWSEYPADPRATYFRRFWDVIGDSQDGGPARPGGIPPIADWPAESALGDHLVGVKSSDKVVLLIRGDLLRRYPRTIIYAAEAAWSPDGKRRQLGTAEKYPLFRGTWGTDVTFLGFDLTEAVAQGASRPPGHPGWFFVIQEPLAEPRFGLDVATSYGGKPASWDQLSWGHLAPDAAALAKLTHVPARGPLDGLELPLSASSPAPRARWGANAAHFALITQQSAFRIAFHASAWLPQSSRPKA
jgi:hypothetical protein